MKKKFPPLVKSMVMLLHKPFLQIFAVIIRFPIYIYLLFTSRLTIKGRRNIPGWTKPYLLMGDHGSYLDPFITSMGTLRPIHWIAADGNFRNGVMRFLMIFLAGAIAKTKNHSDMKSLMDMKAVASLGGIIGLFPEGEMTWHGRNKALVPGTEKLIRFLKIPVVYCHMQGVYLSRPRWSTKARPRKMEIRFETIITGHEAATLKLSEIRDRLKKAVIYDEYALQQRDPRPLKGKHLAEGLERFLFICPHCREMDFLESRGMNLHCTNCGWIMEVNHLGFPSKADPFEDFYQWDLWEQRQLLKLSQQEPSVYLQDQCSLYCGRPKRRSTLQGVGKAVLHGDRIVFHGSSIQFLFPLEQITGLNVFKSGYVEFLFNKMQYRIALEADHPSGYKWDIMCRILMGQWKDPEESCDESE